MSIETPLSGAASPATPEKPYGIIYCATNRINGKRYIGQTTYTLGFRKNGHGIDAKRQTHRFARAINKYGIEGFEWREIDRAISANELNEKEVYWIGFFDSLRRDKGYNLQGGGGAKTMAEETKRKISALLKQTFLNGRVHPNTGKKLPRPQVEKQAAKLREAYAKGFINPRKGVRLTEDTKQRIRLAKKGDDKKTLFTGRHISPPTEFPSVGVRCVETDMIYPSISEAARALGISHTNFSMYLKGDRKSVAGYQWKKL